MKVFDADSHVFEIVDELIEYLEPPYNAPSMKRIPLWPTIDGFNRVYVGINMKLEHEGIAINPQTWLEHMERSGTDRVVLLPTNGLTTGAIADPEWAVIVCRAYNDWFANTYHREDPQRLLGLALLPVQDPVEAAKELRRGVTKLGMMGGLLTARGWLHPLGHHSFYPIYEEAERLNRPIVVHGGYFPGLGYDYFSKLAQAHVLGHPFSQMIAMTSIILEGVLDRFPDLRIGFFEAGCGWVPYMMERMDEEYWERMKPGMTSPSDQIRSGRVYVTVEASPTLSYAAEFMGEDGLLFAGDFPHEFDTPRVKHNIEEIKTSSQYKETLKKKLLSENALRFYGIAE